MSRPGVNGEGVCVERVGWEGLLISGVLRGVCRGMWRGVLKGEGCIERVGIERMGIERVCRSVPPSE